MMKEIKYLKKPVLGLERWLSGKGITKPDDLKLIHRTHAVEGENRLRSRPLSSTCAYTYTPSTHRIFLSLLNF